MQRSSFSLIHVVIQITKQSFPSQDNSLLGLECSGVEPEDLDVGLKHSGVESEDLEVGLKHSGVESEDLEVGLKHSGVKPEDLEVGLKHSGVELRRSGLGWSTQVSGGRT
ncbi:ABC transporter [Plakobranchus ocellatus]|uniref:ABC transporter n=1 Tax=Plakobranchus ocellatus TaxID=259542 RepID=A0AAV3ZL88_9GAST|nr:ABC transporter [Plakobranchus ocellatus]